MLVRIRAVFCGSKGSAELAVKLLSGVEKCTSAVWCSKLKVRNMCSGLGIIPVLS